MVISAFSPASIWNNASRTLTNAAPVLVPTQTAFGTLAAATALDLRPGIGNFTHTTVAVQTGGGATGATAIQAYDGTNVIPLVATAAAANSAAAFFSLNNNVVGVRLNNFDAAVAARYHIINNLWVA